LTSSPYDRSDAPLITALMSVYNGERYLRASIDSILRQTFSDFEFLIVDDGSTDGSAEIIRSYQDSRIRIVTNDRNLGLTKSLNRGLALARGEYIARQDADDISLPHRFEKQRQYLQRNTEVLVLGTQATHIDAEGRKFSAPGWEYAENEVCIRWICMFESPFLHTSVMMRREPLLRRFGGYNDSCVTSQDFELWTRVVYDSVCRNLNEKLVCFRSHQASVSANYTSAKIERVGQILHEAARRGLGQEPPPDWTGLWLRANNPHLYGTKPDIGRIREIVEYMHRHFASNHHLHAGDPEIAQHMCRILMRIAMISVNFDRRESLTLFCSVGGQDLRLAWSLWPRYFLLLVFGNSLRDRIRRWRRQWNAIKM